MNKTHLRTMLQNRFDDWFEKSMRARPSYEFGESASIRFKIGRDPETGSSDQDEWNANIEIAEDVSGDEAVNKLRELIDPTLQRTD